MSLYVQGRILPISFDKEIPLDSSRRVAFPNTFDEKSAVKLKDTRRSRELWRKNTKLDTPDREGQVLVISNLKILYGQRILSGIDLLV